MKVLTTRALTLAAKEYIFKLRDPARLVLRPFLGLSLLGSSWTRRSESTQGTMEHSVVPERTKVTLETMKFVNRAIKSLPVEENQDNYVRSVSGELWSYTGS